jgi:hypothetical protein
MSTRTFEEAVASLADHLRSEGATAENAARTARLAVCAAVAVPYEQEGFLDGGEPYEGPEKEAVGLLRGFARLTEPGALWEGCSLVPRLVKASSALLAVAALADAEEVAEGGGQAPPPIAPSLRQGLWTALDQMLARPCPMYGTPREYELLVLTILAALTSSEMDINLLCRQFGAYVYRQNPDHPPNVTFASRNPDYEALGEALRGFCASLVDRGRIDRPPPV